MGRQRPLNESKTKVLTISGKRLLTRIDHDLAFDAPGECSTCSMCKALDLEIDHELTFIPHVEKLSKKLAQRIGILKGN